MPASRRVQRKLDDMLIVDVDAHHYENECKDDILPFIENEVLRQLHGRPRQGPRPWCQTGMTASRTWAAASRAIRCASPRRPARADPRRRAGIPLDGCHERRLFLPVSDPAAGIGLHPDPDTEVELCWAYNRWLTEKALPATQGRIYSMLACRWPIPTQRCARSRRSATCKDVTGFMVTSVRTLPVHHNRYMKVYRAIEERGLRARLPFRRQFRASRSSRASTASPRCMRSASRSTTSCT